MLNSLPRKFHWSLLRKLFSHIPNYPLDQYDLHQWIYNGYMTTKSLMRPTIGSFILHFDTQNIVYILHADGSRLGPNN